MKKEIYERSALTVTEFDKADVIATSVYNERQEYEMRRMKYIDER